MAETTFLITGATGATGGAAAALLLDKKRRVRVLAHREDDQVKDGSRSSVPRSFMVTFSTSMRCAQH